MPHLLTCGRFTIRYNKGNQYDADERNRYRRTDGTGSNDDTFKYPGWLSGRVSKILEAYYNNR